VRRRCLAFINLMARQGALGQRQRPALFRLLSEGYRNFGFHMDDPKTGVSKTWGSLLALGGLIGLADA